MIESIVQTFIYYVVCAKLFLNFNSYYLVPYLIGICQMDIVSRLVSIKSILLLLSYKLILPNAFKFSYYKLFSIFCLNISFAHSLQHLPLALISLFLYSVIIIAAFSYENYGSYGRFTRASFRPESAQRIIMKFYCVILNNVFIVLMMSKDVPETR